MPDFRGDATGQVIIKPDRIPVGQYEVRLVPKDIGKLGVFYVIQIIPSIEVGKFVAFTFERKTPPKVFALTLTELQDKQEPYEFSKVTVNYPMSHLGIKFMFPSNYFPTDALFDVWYGDARVRHFREYGRVSEACFRKDVADRRRFYMELSIPYPILGLSYLLHWIPPR
jgi:hypothetical protein